MGARFSLISANGLAHLTSSRIRWFRLLPSQAREICLAILDGGGERFVTRRPGWHEALMNSARECMIRLRDVPARDVEVPLSPTRLSAIFETLRPLFRCFGLWGMGLSPNGGMGEGGLIESANKLAAEIGENVLFFVPEAVYPDESQRVLDPYSPLAAAARYPERWPGFAVWTTPFDAVIVPEYDAAPDMGLNSSTDPEDRLLRLRLWLNNRHHAGKSDPQRRRLLHLSDLHFGTDEAHANISMLEKELRSIVPSMHAVVMTGDIVKTVKASLVEEIGWFRNLMAELAHEPVTIWGNHDVKWWGSTLPDPRLHEYIPMKHVEVNDELKIVYLCFNSNKNPRFARGRILPEDLKFVQDYFEAKVKGKPEIGKYRRVVLVHHHPYSFSVEPHTLLQRGMRAVGWDDESELLLEDPEPFLEWCAANSIWLILHGHKHVPRFVRQSRQAKGQPFSRTLSAIGCGSSLGAEGTRIAFDLVSWSEANRLWTVEFRSAHPEIGIFYPDAVQLTVEA